MKMRNLTIIIDSNDDDRDDVNDSIISSYKRLLKKNLVIIKNQIHDHAHHFDHEKENM